MKFAITTAVASLAFVTLGFAAPAPNPAPDALAKRVLGKIYLCPEL